MIDEDKLLTRLKKAKESKRRAKEAKEKEAKERKEKIGEYRDMADRVEEYFDDVTDEQLEKDLRKARFDFYKLIRMSILT